MSIVLAVSSTLVIYNRIEGPFLEIIRLVHYLLMKSGSLHYYVVSLMLPFFR